MGRDYTGEIAEGKGDFRRFGGLSDPAPDQKLRRRPVCQSSVRPLHEAGMPRILPLRHFNKGKGMNMRCIYISAAAAVLLAVGPAQAQEHKRSEFMLGYTSISDVEDGGSYLIEIKSDWAISGAFGLQGNLAFRDTESPVATSVIGLHGYYEFPSGTRAGLFYQQQDLILSGAPFEPRFETMGIEAIVGLSPKARLELYLGAGDVSGLPIPITGYTSYGVEASYDFSPNWRGRIHYDLQDLEASLPAGSMSEMGVGIDYFVDGAGSGVPLILTAEFERYNTPFGSDDLSAFSLKVTVPIGGETTSGGRQLFGNRNGGDLFLLTGG
jgi:hypothetical protein